jgi:hypothetical protein
MTHQGLEKSATAGTLPRASAQPIAPASWLPPSAVWLIAAFAGLSGALYLHQTEGEPASLFCAAVLLTIAALVVLISRRLLPSVVLVCAMLAIIHTAAYIKQQTTEVLLHAYDLVSLLSSWLALSHFWHDHRQHALGLMAAVFATALVACIGHRVDGTRVQRRYAAGAAALFFFLACLASAAKGERRHTEFYFENVYVSFFLSSWSETIVALWRGEMIEAARGPAAPRLNEPAPCEPRPKPPHIILIHQESVVPPSHFPSLSYDRSLDPFFHSYDGQLRKLRVETYGGASWLTEFSVLTGLSTYSFGGMRPFVQQVMAGKVRDTLPQALARCGYRSVVFYPMLRHFLGAGKFFEGVGLPEIFDAKKQGAASPNERDRFYYTNLLAEMHRHFESSRQPLFAFVETMATHGAYDYAYMPEVDVPGGGPGTQPEMHEYLRRLAMARMDYAFLRAELFRRFPDQQFLIVHYGDHQPTATWTLHDFGKDTTMEKVMESGNAPALMTYYVVDGVRYQGPALPAFDALDVPYLGTIILESARLPLSDPYRERRRLMLLCKGRYHDCPARDEVMKFHRRLVDFGLVNAR